MKKLLTILLLLGSLTLGATTYYVSSSDGDDGDSGLTTVLAWATLDKVHATTFAAGDSVLFKRGDIFRGSIYQEEDGTAGARIYYGAYGTGNKPRMYGAKNLSATGDWENHQGDTIWKTTATLGTAQNDISNLVFNYETSWGVKCNALARLNSPGKFWYNPSDDLLYLNADANPGTAYTQIEACGNYGVNQGIFKWINSSYITVQNIDFRYSSAAGIEFQACDHVVIENCDLSWIGGEYLSPPGTSDSTRLGNGISLWLANSDFDIRYNKVNQCFDAGISPQGTGTFTQSNVWMYYNIVTNCYYSYEVWAATGATNTDINFDNNTCINAGSGWSNSSAQRADLNNARHVMIWNDQGTVTTCNIRNNIFKTCANEAVRYSYSADKYQLDYNLYYVDSVAVTGAGSFVTLTAWKAAAVAQDQHSISGDPLFASPSNFRLQAASPAIDEAVDVSLTTDIVGHHQYGGAWDIGAYEWGKWYVLNSGKVVNSDKIVTINR